MFDGIPPKEIDPRIAQIDQVIGAFPKSAFWLQNNWRAGHRRCLGQVLRDLGLEIVLTEPILAAVQQETGQIFSSVPSFNDDRSTTFDVVMSALRRTRDNLTGEFIDAQDVPIVEPTLPRRSPSKVLAAVTASALFIATLIV